MVELPQIALPLKEPPNNSSELLYNWFILQQQSAQLKVQLAHMLNQNEGLDKSNSKPYKIQSRHVNIAKHIYQAKKTEIKQLTETKGELKTHKETNSMNAISYGICNSNEHRLY